MQNSTSFIKVDEARLLTISGFYDSLRIPIRQVFAGREFTICGDVESVNAFNEHLYVTLLDNSDGKISRITVFIPGDVICSDNEIRVGIKVQFTGTVMMGRNGVQLRALEYLLLGKSRMDQLKDDWSKSFRHLMDRVKPELPLFFPNVAVITNSDIQGYGDFDKHLSYGRIQIFHTKMQGGNVACDASDAIRLINGQGGYDCICLVRGGGGEAELFEFNRPELLEAIADSRIPVLTAIGHESDKLLCDLVASKRFSTPTAAAVYLTSQADSLRSSVSVLSSTIRARVNEIGRLEGLRVVKSFSNGCDRRYDGLEKAMLISGGLMVLYYVSKLISNASLQAGLS